MFVDSCASQSPAPGHPRRRREQLQQVPVRELQQQQPDEHEQQQQRLPGGLRPGSALSPAMSWRDGRGG
jgi:hypothetical protein